MRFTKKQVLRVRQVSSFKKNQAKVGPEEHGNSFEVLERTQAGPAQNRDRGGRGAKPAWASGHPIHASTKCVL